MNTSLFFSYCRSVQCVIKRKLTISELDDAYIEFLYLKDLLS